MRPVYPNRPSAHRGRMLRRRCGRLLAQLERARQLLELDGRLEEGRCVRHLCVELVGGSEGGLQLGLPPTAVTCRLHPRCTQL